MEFIVTPAIIPILKEIDFVCQSIAVSFNFRIMEFKDLFVFVENPVLTVWAFKSVWNIVTLSKVSF